jgi:hypothetical protein
MPHAGRGRADAPMARVLVVTLLAVVLVLLPG